MRLYTFFFILLLLFSKQESLFSYNLLIINSQNSEPYIPVLNSLMRKLEELGYSEKDNLKISSWSIANSDGLARRAWMSEKNKSYDVIFLNGTLAASNFKNFAQDDFRYKFVFGAVTDPVGLGLIKDFENNPLSNFTGVSYPVKVKDRLSFIKKVMPDVKTIGMIYADMPQSISYRRWLEEALKEEEFSDMTILFRSVEFIQSEEGHKRMAMLAEKFIKELDPQVDLFMSANDQMGVQAPFAQAVYSMATKPLIGVGQKDVLENWGATLSIYPRLDRMGEQAAYMIQKIFEGVPFSDIKPQWPEIGVAFDLKKAAQFKISIPEDLILMAGENIVR